MVSLVRQASDAVVGLTVQRSSATATADLVDFVGQSGTVLSFIGSDGHLQVPYLDCDAAGGSSEWRVLNNASAEIRLYNNYAGVWHWRSFKDVFMLNAVQFGILNPVNSLSDVKVLGRKTTPGIPTTSAWSTNDAIIDSVGGVHLCTAGGTPGTWIGGGWQLAGFWLAASALATSGAITIPAFDELMIIVRIVPGVSATDIPALRFNADTGNNYRSRYLVNNAVSGVTLTDVPTATTNMARLSGLSATTGRVTKVIINNKLAAGKVGTVASTNATNSLTVQPGIDLAGGFEWVNTAAQITSVTLLTVSASTMPIDSGMQIYGRNFA